MGAGEDYHKLHVLWAPQRERIAEKEIEIQTEREAGLVRNSDGSLPFQLTRPRERD